MVLNITVAIILIIHGIYSIYAGFKNKPITSLVFSDDSFIAKKIFRKNYDRVANFSLGIIHIILGILTILYL